jgi:RimJ/RimL family protein N-acetyltransferase
VEVKHERSYLQKVKRQLDNRLFSLEKVTFLLHQLSMMAFSSNHLSGKLRNMVTETRVYLSPIQDEHIDRYMALSDDPELIATMGWKPFGPNEKERFTQFLQLLTLPNLEGGRAMVFSIINATDNKAIGYTSIQGISEKERRAEVGIAIMEKEYRGHGYGTEALRHVVNYAFIELGLTLLGLTVFPSNQRAIRAYEKVGFRKTDVLENSWLLPGGEYADMWVMELSHNWLP